MSLGAKGKMMCSHFFFFGRGGNAGNNGWPLADADAMMTSGSASRMHHFFRGTREDGQFSALLCRSVLEG